MQLWRLCSVFLTAATVGTSQPIAADKSSSASYGPAGCVSLDRSDVGSCVIKTNCEEHDISNFDFSFDCLTADGAKTHSLGVGSFDETEEFDTDVNCQECLPPGKTQLVAAAVATKTTPALRATATQAEAISRQAVAQLQVAVAAAGSSSRVVPAVYGPNDCVSVERDPDSGTCIMKTDCMKGVDLSMYEFGMVCVDDNNEMTRHLYGTNSFGHKERFDTVIKCDKCKALDQGFDGTAALAEMVGVVKELKNKMQGITTGIAKLNATVFAKDAAAPALAAADDSDAAAASATPTAASPAAAAATVLAAVPSQDVINAKMKIQARNNVFQDDDDDKTEAAGEDDGSE